MNNEQININELSSIQLDALKEIANIGAGNAATAFSQLLEQRIDMSVPEANILPLSEVPEILGGAETLIAGILVKVAGDAPGKILFALEEKSAEKLTNMLLDEKLELDLKSKTDQIQDSTLEEIGNILTNSYLNALSRMTDFSLLPSVPALAYDMAGAILEVTFLQAGHIGDYALVVETEFLDGDEGIQGHFFFIPTPESLQKILDKLGVGKI
ncbi:chemotaxis protein CheC [Selenihalanaerobacter shriftii]|uniref:Chemotaxis protein CheC n=1 Tax=Selenihalanaerobacter shriftii TaxID=142842 RepID=A0A1T4MCL5_9FIRM|nr:chemotaxis protein CheC [Selenihalanaerobacter shriftii]SJZ64662.1 chemotaxis protein CheC [Selenihalanaerobacter shriftii]